MENRIEVFEYKKRSFIYYDLSGLSSNADFEAFIATASELLKSHPQNSSLLSITNIEGVVYDSHTKDLVSQWMVHNRPYIKCGAVIGLDGIKKIMVNSILKMSGRNNMAFFNTKQQAMDWLISQ